MPKSATEINTDDLKERLFDDPGFNELIKEGLEGHYDYTPEQLGQIIVAYFQDLRAEDEAHAKNLGIGA